MFSTALFLRHPFFHRHQTYRAIRAPDQDRVATRLVLKYNIRAGGDHHLGSQVLLAVELDALFDGDEADLAMDQRFHDLDHLPAGRRRFSGQCPIKGETWSFCDR